MKLSFTLLIVGFFHLALYSQFTFETRPWQKLYATPDSGVVLTYDWPLNYPREAIIQRFHAGGYLNDLANPTAIGKLWHGVMLNNQLLVGGAYTSDYDVGWPSEPVAYLVGADTLTTFFRGDPECDIPRRDIEDGMGTTTAGSLVIVRGDSAFVVDQLAQLTHAVILEPRLPYGQALDAFSYWQGNEIWYVNTHNGDSTRLLRYNLERGTRAITLFPGEFAAWKVIDTKPQLLTSKILFDFLGRTSTPVPFADDFEQAFNAGDRFVVQSSTDTLYGSTADGGWEVLATTPFRQLHGVVHQPEGWYVYDSTTLIFHPEAPFAARENETEIHLLLDTFSIAQIQDQANGDRTRVTVSFKLEVTNRSDAIIESVLVNLSGSGTLPEEYISASDGSVQIPRLHSGETFSIRLEREFEYFDHHEFDVVHLEACVEFVDGEIVWEGRPMCANVSTLNPSKTHEAITFPIEVSPNPVSSRARIQSSNVVERYRLLDLKGRIVKDGKPQAARFDLECGGLVPGLYQLICQDTHGQEAVRRLLVARRE